MQKKVYPMQSSFKCCTFLIAAFLLGFAALGQETKVVDIHAPNIDDQYNGVCYKDLKGIYYPILTRRSAKWHTNLEKEKVKLK